MRAGDSIIRIGVASWTVKSMIAPGVFYPDDAGTAEARLRYYASRFRLVEADSSYYALPAVDVAARWVERTPADFTFNVKAFAWMTGHATDPGRLPADLREQLPPAQRGRARLRPDDVAPAVVDSAWERFIGAIAPLRDAGRLGAILLQYPPWFAPSRESAARIVRDAARLHDAGMRSAVELRNAAWFAGRVGARTVAYLREHAIPFVMVDEPQGHDNSVPPLHAVTSPDLAIVRFHGRRAETWSTPGVGVEERFRYLYDPRELEPWVEPVRAAAQQAREVHAVFNNCYANFATTNAAEFAAMLAG